MSQQIENIKTKNNRYAELKLSTALRELLEFSQRSETGLTLGDIIDRTGEKAFSVLLGFLCLPFLILAIPGTSTPFGLAMMFLGGQMALRWDRPWLPMWLRNRHLPKKGTESVLRGVTKVFRPLERVIRPRLLFMQSHGAYILVGIALIIDALLLALPLPIPGSNTPPAWAILFKVLGSTEDDGVLLIVGLICTLIMVGIGITVGILGVDAITALLGISSSGAATAPSTMPEAFTRPAP